MIGAWSRDWEIGESAGWRSVTNVRKSATSQESQKRALRSDFEGL